MRPQTVAVLLVLALTAGCLGGSTPRHEPLPEPTDTGVTQGTLHVDFTHKPQVPRAGQRVQFEDKSSDTEFDLVSHAWDFGDGKGSTLQDPSHTYSVSGKYRVSLRVRTSGDGEAALLRNITVTASPADPSAPPNPDVPTPPGGPTEYLSFGEPVQVRGSQGGEPSLAIDKEGRIYVNPIGRLYRSEDEGKTFQQTAYPPIVVSGDSHTVVDPDGLVWVSDLGGLTVPVYGSVAVWTSADHGNSWGKGNPAATDSAQVDRQWLAAPGGGIGYLLTRQCLVASPTGVCVSFGSLLTKSTDAGLTWTLTGHQFAWTSFPFVDSKDGTLYIVQADGTSVNVAVSTDRAATFKSVRVANRATSTENLFVTGDVDDAGNAYVAWVDRDSKQNDVWMSSTTSKGTRWSRAAQVSSGVGTNIMPWLTAGGDGKVAVAWYATEEVGQPESVNGDWFVASAISLNGHDELPAFAQSRATGTVHEGPICLGGATCGEADRDLLDFLSVDLMPDGRVAIAFGSDGAGSVTKTLFTLQDSGPLAR